MRTLVRFVLRPVLAVIASLVLVLAGISSVSAQTILSTTTLSAAVSSPGTTTITVGSATGFVAGSIVFVELEVMRIVSVSGTTITVQRGYAGTRASKHTSGARVYVGTPDQFYSVDPPFESCTRAQQIVLPWINVASGNVWNCDTVGEWYGTNILDIAWNSIVPNGNP